MLAIPSIGLKAPSVVAFYKKFTDFEVGLRMHKGTSPAGSSRD